MPAAEVFGPSRSDTRWASRQMGSRRRSSESAVQSVVIAERSTTNTKTAAHTAGRGARWEAIAKSSEVWTGQELTFAIDRHGVEHAVDGLVHEDAGDQPDGEHRRQGAQHLDAVVPGAMRVHSLAVTPVCQCLGGYANLPINIANRWQGLLLAALAEFYHTQLTAGHQDDISNSSSRERSCPQRCTSHTPRFYASRRGAARRTRRCVSPGCAASRTRRPRGSRRSR